MTRIRAWLGVTALVAPLLPAAVGITTAVAQTAPPAPHWTLTTPAPPLPAVDAPMVYDEARKQVVMLDGTQLWIWAGKVWKKVWTYNGDTTNPNGPSPRSDPSMVYDPMSKRVLLFGGVSLGNSYDDTWLWDGSHWSQPASTTGATAVKPPARSSAGIVYDVAMQKVVMFGGTKSGSTVLSDTWVWNGTQGAAGWTQLPTPAGTDPAPAGRFDAGFVYDASRKQVVMFGGTGVNDQSLTDASTWVLNPTATAWTVAAKTGPGVRVGAAMAYDPWSKRTVLVGGVTYTVDGHYAYKGDTWAWNGRAWSPVNGSLEIRTQSVLVADGECRCLVLVGGRRSTLGNSGLGESWKLIDSRWQTVAPHPAPRAAAAVAYDAASKQVVLFGGDSTWTSSLGDTWVWTGRGGWTESTANGPPGGNWQVAYDPARDTLLAFGTWSSGTATWTWDGIRWRHVSNTAPPGVELTLGFDTARSELVAFYSPAGPSTGKAGSTMVWDGRRWTQAKGPEPLARSGAQIAYDPPRKQLVLFGGRGCPTAGVLGTGTGPDVANGTDYCSDTWTWNGKQWSKVAGVSPPGRAGAVMAYSPADRAIVMFGGVSSYRVGDQAVAPSYNPVGDRFLGDTWTFDGRGWTAKASATAAARTGAAFGYDPNSRQVLMFGGLGYTSAAGSEVALPGSETQTPQGDTRLWDRSTWAQPSGLHAVPARTYASLLYDRAIGKSVLIGGLCQGPAPFVTVGSDGYGPDTEHTLPCADMWGWDGRNWTKVDDNKPPYGTPVYVERAGRIALMSNGLWTWGR